MCVKITTGDAGQADGYGSGYVGYNINGVKKNVAKYELGWPVYDACFDSEEAKGLTIKLFSDKDNAWMGNIVITEGGRPTAIYCKGCSTEKWIHNTRADVTNIAVEGDSNADGWWGARGHCVSEATCTIIWSRFGTVEISIVYLMKR